MRLIDADALNLDYEVEMADDWNTAHEIANVVKYAPTIDVPTWIPCSERLPEEETECLVTDSHGRIRHCVKDKCGNYEFATYEEYMHIDAIAWMPLPKPYEETDHE